MPPDQVMNVHDWCDESREVSPPYLKIPLDPSHPHSLLSTRPRKPKKTKPGGHKALPLAQALKPHPPLLAWLEAPALSDLRQ